MILNNKNKWKEFTDLNIALVDDETESLKEMEQLCLEYEKKKLCQLKISPFSNGQKFLDALEETSFSIVFMDIFMEEMDGVTAARKLRELDDHCLLVFLTTSSEFMPEAFSCHAFEYVRKPVLPERVEQVLDDALKILPRDEKSVMLPCNRKTVSVFLRDIVSVTSNAHYLDFSMEDGSNIRCRMTVPEFLRLIEDDSRFVLGNRGVLLNAGHILAFEEKCCIMDNGTQPPLRVRDTGRILQAVNNYNFDIIRQKQKNR